MNAVSTSFLKSKLVITLLLFILTVPLLAGCGSNTSHSTADSEMSAANDVPVMSDHAMPDYVVKADARVQEAYDYAVTNPNDLTHQPCYCGCNRMGHKNNLECYVKGVDDQGQPIFDNHAAYCGVCIDITLDVKHMKAEGTPALIIRQYIDTTYSHFGPSTDTPLPLG